MSGAMWKPGSAKPSPSNNSSEQKANKRNRDVSKNNDNGGDEEDNNENGSNIPRSGSPTSTSEKKKKASLSGATMNMRFMQRKKEQQSYEKKHHAKVEEPSPMDVDNNEDHSADHSDDDSIQPQLPQDELVSSAPATSADMYGISVQVIGRRSFGGFNRAIEDTWKSSYRSHREVSQGASNKTRASDEELLQRYANLVKDRRGDGDNSRKPVGNLSKKGQRNKPRSGEKRKRR
jgi:hypothetical protein